MICICRKMTKFILNECVNCDIVHSRLDSVDHLECSTARTSDTDVNICSTLLQGRHEQPKPRCIPNRRYPMFYQDTENYRNRISCAIFFFTKYHKIIARLSQKYYKISQAPHVSRQEKCSTPSEIYDIFSQALQVSRVFLTFKL